MKPITSDSVWLGDDTHDIGYAFVDRSYFVNNALTLAYSVGNSGSASLNTVILTYVDDTTFTSKASMQSTRELYVYGI